MVDEEMQQIEKVNLNQVNCEVDMASFENMRKMALEIAIGKTEAPAPHEKVVVAVIVIWVAVITCICFFGVTMRQKELIVGITVNINLLFFYGAPLSTIFTVLKSQDSGSIHRWTMLMNTANASFWTAFGIGTKDYFVLVPNGIGAVLGVIQMILCLLVPSQAATTSSTNESGFIEKVDIELSANATPAGN
jgi:solute carrier family 50 protein (sugar transporter)